MRHVQAIPRDPSTGLGMTLFQTAASTRVSARDVHLEMGNRRRLRGDNPLHQIADRNNAADRFAIEHGQMPDAFVRHHLHAIFYGLARANDREIARHDFAHVRFARFLAAEHDFARVIALRDHPDQFPILSDEKRADVFVRHQLDRFEHGGIR